MDRLLIIESTCPLWQVGGKRFSAVFCSMEEQFLEIIDFIKEGAIAIRVHPRYGVAKIDFHLLKKLLG